MFKAVRVVIASYFVTQALPAFSHWIVAVAAATSTPPFQMHHSFTKRFSPGIFLLGPCISSPSPAPSLPRPLTLALIVRRCRSHITPTPMASSPRPSPVPTSLCPRCFSLSLHSRPSPLLPMLRHQQNNSAASSITWMASTRMHGRQSGISHKWSAAAASAFVLALRRCHVTQLPAFRRGIACP